jgi:protein ImuB
VLVRTVATRQVILSASREAIAAGIRPGLTLTQARALCTGVEAVEHEPHRDAVALEALARWMMRFTPVVAIASRGDDDPAPAVPRRTTSGSVGHPRNAGARVARFAQGERLIHDRPVRAADAPAADTRDACLLLDLGGCERLFGGLEPLLGRIVAGVRSLRFDAVACVAPTPAAARALSCDPANHRRIVTAEQLDAALAPLPPASLGLSPAVSASLRHVGITTIALLQRLPRDELPARFGRDLLRRLDQATGAVPEPIVPLEPLTPIVQAMEFEDPVDSLEVLWMALGRLLPMIAQQLARRGRGARRIELDLLRPRGGEPARHAVEFARPARDPQLMFQLIRCALEQDASQLGLHAGRSKRRRRGLAAPRPQPPARDGSDPAPVYHDDGYVGLRLEVTRADPVSDTQSLLIDDDLAASSAELARLVERLCVRMGRESVVRARPVPSYVPERSWQAMAALDDADPLPLPPAPIRPGLATPLCLLPVPREAKVIVSPSHDLDGRPVWIDVDRDARAIVHACGPNRVAGEWWAGHLRTRDYFDVEDEQGRRMWIFRVLENGRWFVHGSFG